jgi:hypothetical protein
VLPAPEDESGLFDYERQRYEAEHMRTGTVQELGASQNGKPKVKIDGTWYFVQSNNGMNVGSAIEFDPDTFEISGKTFNKIKAWGPAARSSANNPPVSQQAGGLPEPQLRFISNVVGSAIASGAIKAPEHIAGWFEAAKDALEGRDAGKPFNDPLEDRPF